MGELIFCGLRFKTVSYVSGWTFALARKWRLACFFALFGSINGCVTIDYEVEPAPPAAVDIAKREIKSQGRLVSNGYSLQENIDRLSKVDSRLREHARDLCLALGERSHSECGYTLRYEKEGAFNAYATEEEGQNLIVVTTGTLELTQNEEELAFIVAHEIGHHISDHVSGDVGLTVGEGIGLLIGLAIVSDDSYTAEDAVDIVETTTAIGGMADRPAFNRGQELEADLFAIKLLHNAGFDVDKGITVLRNLATISNPSGFFSTHPAGPQRLANARSYKSQPALARIEIAEMQYCPSCNDQESTLYGPTIDIAKRTGDEDVLGFARSPSNLQQVLNSFSKLEDYWVGLNIPQKKLRAFIKKAGLPQNTASLAYLDTTVWGSGANGILFTDSGIHYTNDWTAGAGGTHFVSYEDFAAKGKPYYKGQYLYLGVGSLKQGGLIDLIGANTDLAEVVSLLRSIQLSRIN